MNLCFLIERADSGNQDDPFAVKRECTQKEGDDNIFRTRQNQAHYCKYFADLKEIVHANRPVDIAKKRQERLRSHQKHTFYLVESN